MDIILGKVALTMEGTWAAHNSYPKLSYVTHEGDGWISRKASINVEPGTNDTVWRKATDVQPYIEAMQSATDAAVATNTAIIDAEQLRAQAENARVIAELLRESEEADREADERDRAAAEHERETAEAARDAAEDAREAAESAREAAEATRESNTDAALENVSTAIAAAGAATSAADTAAGSANTAADAAESAAGSADTAAAAATTAAGTATSAAAAATAAATEAKKLPYIDETTKTWMVYNASTHEYEDSEVAADDANKADKVTTATAGHIATLTAGGNLADGGVAASDLAHIDGYYSSLTAGLAENLIDTKGDGTQQEFVRRTSCGEDSIADDGSAIIKKVEGNTIVWNQLVKEINTTNFRETDTGIISNGKITFSRKTTGYYDSIPVINSNATLISGHRYYLAATISNNTIEISDSTRYLTLATLISKGVVRAHFNKNNGRISEITTCDDNAAGNINAIGYVSSTSSYPWSVGSFEISDVILIDLTKMFGAGNEPSTVAEFEALFPDSYYAYNAGTLLSLNATGIKTDGFNQYNGNYAHVFGGKEYYIGGTYTSVKYAATIDGEQSDVTVTDHLFTPAADGYIFVEGSAADTIINLSWGGYRNGEFEPYWSETRNLPSLDAFGGSLKSVGNIYDEMTASQDIKRIGERPYEAGDEDDASVLTDGTTTQYVLEEPVVTDYGEPRNLTYKVADFGTEEVVPQGVDEDGIPATAPFKAVIKYNDDYTRTIANLPKNYQSQESMDAALTALGTALGFSWSKTFDGSKYTYTITTNTPV